MEKEYTHSTTEQHETVRAESETYREAIDVLASELHEAWRSARLNGDGSHESRIRSTADETWIAAHDTDQVDIAQVAYSELPEDLQAEHNAAAAVVVDVLYEANGQIDLLNPDMRDIAGEEMHTAWLSRNDWAKGGELDVPFVELSQDQQNRYLDQVAVANSTFSGNSFEHL